MEVVQVRGVVESLTWDERGVGTLKFTDPSMLPVYIKELQKPELPKDLKKGDTVTVTGNQGQKHLFLLNMKLEEATPPLEPSSVASITLRPPAEQPPKLTEDYNIPYSAKRIGELYPIIVDPEGNIIDGLHRHNHDPNWRKEVVPWVRSRKDFLIARIHANLHRRDVPKEERQRDFTELANILVNEGEVKGKLAGKISELTGFSIDWVRDLLPQSYKLREKSQAGKAAHPSAGLKPAQGVTSPQSTTLPDAKVPVTAEGFAKTIREAPSGSIDLTAWSCPQCKGEYRIDWKGMKIEPA
jgi:hypothetical protein